MYVNILSHEVSIMVQKFYCPNGMIMASFVVVSWCCTECTYFIYYEILIKFENIKTSKQKVQKSTCLSIEATKNLSN